MHKSTYLLIVSKRNKKLNKTKKFCWAETKNRLRAVKHSAESIFEIECLSEYEFIFETDLACKPGDRLVLLKNGESKISWRCPLSYFNFWHFRLFLINLHYDKHVLIHACCRYLHLPMFRTSFGNLKVLRFDIIQFLFRTFVN
jgi:hypothetical protein